MSDAAAERWITIELDGDTAARLERLSAACRDGEESVAASLLHDILKEDEDCHLLLSAPAPSSALN